MVLVVFLIIRLHNLFAVAMLTGIYSLMAATFFVVVDAVDVAFTEAAVGAGISTVLMLGALSLTVRRENVAAKKRGGDYCPSLSYSHSSMARCCASSSGLRLSSSSSSPSSRQGLDSI